jgi:outer membrane lipoprotein-sorting protein
VPRILLALCLTLCAASASAQQAPTLESVLTRFSRLPGLEARFVEEKRIALLAVPVRSEGRLYFSPPGRLWRRVTSPEASVALIDAGRLRMRQGERVEDLSIDENPVLRGFIDSFRAVLAGDREALERFYRAELTVRAADGPQAWELRLRPRGGALARFLREIRIRGDDVTLTEMEMIEVNGDRTRTEFHDVDTQRRYDAAESRRLFRLE